MPKSKKAKAVSLTKTVKKTRETKVLLMSKIKDLCKSHTHIYIISIDNERNQILKDLRKARKDDVFVFGSNKVIAKALGTDEKTECRSGINILSKLVSGPVGLVFSKNGPEELASSVGYFERTDYARCGTVAPEDVVLYKGPLLKVSGEKIPHYMEEHLRKIGLPTRLDDGNVVLISDYTVCKRGQKIDSNQAKILKHIGIRNAKMCIRIQHMWTGGKVYDLSEWPKITPCS